LKIKLTMIAIWEKDTKSRASKMIMRIQAGSMTRCQFFPIPPPIPGVFSHPHKTGSGLPAACSLEG